MTLSGKFTKHFRTLSISVPQQNMQNFPTELRRTESNMLDNKLLTDDDPAYENPKDVIGVGIKPQKPPRKRNIEGVAFASSTLSRDDKLLLKDEKRKLVKKYERLIGTLLEKYEQNASLVKEKDSYILKLKEKLKSVLEYNKLFADENDQLKTQHAALIKYINDCKTIIKEERDRNSELEARNKIFEDRLKQYELPARDSVEPQTVIPLVEVCMSCSSRQILLNQARDQNTRLQKDMQALKDVLYRLNVQLSRYQERLRDLRTLMVDTKEVAFNQGDKLQGLDALLTASLEHKTADAEDAHSVKSGAEDHSQSTRSVDMSGLLSAQALAPLFDAYQENLEEKENLILDYEKQFENMNKKSKQVVEENKSLLEKVNSLEDELVQMRQKYKKSVMERETADVERATLVQRAERAELKLKEVYELYEDKMAAMMRDYETVHREYFTVKTALEASTGKMAQIDALRARTVPADLHERKLENCKRLLEELKHQYNMESERKAEHIKKLEQELSNVKEKYEKLSQEHEATRADLKSALKNVRLYRKAASIFRQRVKTTTARMSRVRRSMRKTKNTAEPLQMALARLEKIKSDIKMVKTRAHTSLEELERRIVEQERRAALAQAEYRRELERATLALEHKEGIIRSLIDKVADVEEVRLSQSNTQRLQGILSEESSPENSVQLTEKLKKVSKTTVKLVPGPGGYFQDEVKRKDNKQ